MKRKMNFAQLSNMVGGYVDFKRQIVRGDSRWCEIYNHIVSHIY